MCAKDGFPFRVSSKLILRVSSLNYTRTYIYTFVSCLQVFSTSEDLQYLFEKANYTLSSSPNSIKTLVVKFAAQRKNDLIGILKQDLKTAALSMTMDEWTSTRNRRYTNVNVHKQGRHNNLGLIRIIGSCDALRFCSMLHQLLGEYGIDPKRHICGITTDGAAVMKKFQDIMPTTPQLCFAHAIHLAVCDVIFKAKDTSTNLTNFAILHAELETADDEEDVVTDEQEYDSAFKIDEGDDVKWVATSDFNDLSSLLKKVRIVVNRFKRSPVLTEELLLKHIRNDNLKDVGLLLDCQTRWSSTYDMLYRFVYLKSAIDKALYDSKFEERFSKEDWFLLESIVKSLELVAVTVKKICAHDATLLTADTAISFLIRQMGLSPFELKLKGALLKRVLERRTTNSDVLQFLHNQNETALIDEFSMIYKKAVGKVIKQLAERLVDDCDVIVDDLTDDNEGPKNVEQELDELLSNQTRRLASVPLAVGSNGIGSEIDVYNRTGVKEKLITRLYDSLLTSVEAERSFSTAGRRCTKFRARLSDEALHALVFLHSYFNNPY